MTKEQVFEMLKEISVIWERFEVTQEKIDTWYRYLKDEKQELVSVNLFEYVMGNKFPPTIADLTKERELKVFVDLNDVSSVKNRIEQLKTDLEKGYSYYVDNNIVKQYAQKRMELNDLNERLRSLEAEDKHSR